jgi:hypothetical protein
MHARIRRMEDKSSLSRFWLPGAFGSLAAAPTVPGWAYTTCGQASFKRHASSGPNLRKGIWDRSVKLSGFYRSGARHISATDLTQYLLADLIVRVFFALFDGEYRLFLCLSRASEIQA